MDKNSTTFVAIMFFYFILSYIIFPLLLYYLVDKTLFQLGNGFVLGSFISAVLWILYGNKLVRN